MKILLTFLMLIFSLDMRACVEYDKVTNTYTVDPSGCIDIDDDEFLDPEWNEF